MTLRWNRVFKYSSCVRCVLRQEWGIQFFDTCSINNARHLLSAICSRVLHVNVSRWLIDNYMEVSRTSFRARLWFFGRWLVRSEDVSFRSGNKYVRMVAARGEWTNTFQVPLYPIPDYSVRGTNMSDCFSPGSPCSFFPSNRILESVSVQSENP